MSRLVWVAVPGGPRGGGGAILRVVVIPVLDQPLADAGMGTWPPASLASARLSIDVEGAGSPGVTLTAAAETGVVTGAWEAFFGGIGVRTAGARAESADRVARTVEVAETTADAARVSAAYGAAALVGATGAGAAPQSVPETPAGDRRDGDPSAEIASTVAAAIGDQTGRAARRAGRQAARSGGDRETTIDANLALSLLREHPTVMRALGLIIDLRLIGDDLARLPRTGRLRVTWSDAPRGIPPIESRWTAYQRDGFRAVPRPSSPLHAGGSMVRLADPSWKVVTFDPEHALGGLVEVVQTQARHGLPSVRSAGLLVAHTGRQADLETRLGRPSLAAGGGADDALYADDLVLGYRLDVRPHASSSWRSLTARTASYSVGELTLAHEVSEEGQVKVGSAVDAGDGTLRATEVVTRWDGWSLAVPRPALTSRRTRGPVERPAAGAGLPFHLTSELTVPAGSMPRLTFGGEYTLRLRVADLAGGGAPVTAQSPDGCDVQTFFPRHEAVAPPVVCIAESSEDPPSYGPGASLLSLVLRAPADGVAPPTPAGADTVRELRAPTTTLEVVERHGLTAPSNRADGRDLADRAQRDDQGLADPGSGGLVGWVRLPRSSEPDIESLSWSEDWLPSGPSVPPVGTAPWPDLPTRQLVLLPRTDDTDPTLVWDGDRLIVRLAPGTETQVELSSLLHHAARPGFALSQWLSAAAGAAGITGSHLTTLERQLVEGRNPLATPPVAIRVRHAVRRPLGRPEGSFSVARPESTTYADLTPYVEPVEEEAGGPDPDAALLGIHPGSTVAVEVTATWTPVEDLDDPGAVARPVGRISVALDTDRLPSLRHELGDTKHREVDYTLTALSRYRDCYDDGLSAATEEFAVSGTLHRVTVPSSARPPVPVVRAVVPGFVWRESTDAEGVVRRERLGNRVRVQLAAPWYASGDGERLVVLTGERDPASAVPTTQSGRDPIWQTGDAVRWPVPRGPVVQVAPPGSGEAVTATEVVAWRGGGAWWADIAFDDHPSYGALVQLALARHQPFSGSADIATSAPVITDWVPLLPDRTLTVTPLIDAVHVQLDGIAPAGPATNLVEMVLERRLEDETPDGVVSVDEEGTIWAVASDVVTGEVGETLTVARVDPEMGALRVRIREIERIASGLLGPVAFPQLAERVVFADAVRV